MALNFFTQRDIEEIEMNNLPKAFIEYFSESTSERQNEILLIQPDLVTALKYHHNLSEMIMEDIYEDTSEKLEDAELIREIEEFQNYYSEWNFSKTLYQNLNPFIAYGIHDNQKKCLLHKAPLVKKEIRYEQGKGIYGVVVFYCEQCHRLYLEESKINSVIRKMEEINLEAHVFKVGETEKYLRSHIAPKEVLREDIIYIPEVWVEENATCPIHDSSLWNYPYYTQYKDRRIDFDSYYCDDCNKIILRRTKALKLEQECAEKGIPFMNVNTLKKEGKVRKILPPKEIIPDYYIRDGKLIEYNFNYNIECYKVTKEDIFVVSLERYCVLGDHNSKDVLTLIPVEMKKGDVKTFLCYVSYCNDCQKYYIEEADYKIIYSKGRPDVMIVHDTEHEYYITSGEVFDVEKKHLSNLEYAFDNITNRIEHSSDYVSKYSVGDYDDGQLQTSKAKSVNKYEKELLRIREYKSKPYSYRVDISFAGKTEIYYLGASDIEIEGNIHVISYNSPFGNKLVNYRTVNLIQNGRQYDIKLNRQFDIEQERLYGYINLRTDEDLIFRQGITDPFLIRVLNMRKRQHSLIDIIATIQENQNAIVDAPFYKNIVIQGCAGSGKTMVLLHRLSSLKYNHPEFDFNHALILTPNEQFNLHINGLAVDLQIGNIQRISVEQYYIDLLLAYDPAFKPTNPIVSEIYVRKEIVDFVYSDEYLTKFNQAYVGVIQRHNALLNDLNKIFIAMNELIDHIDISETSKTINLMQRQLDRLLILIHMKESAINNQRDKVDKINSRKEFLTGQIPKSSELANNIVNETLARVYVKLKNIMEEYQGKADYFTEEREKLKNEIERVQNSFNPFGKNQKLVDLQVKIDRTSTRIDSYMEKKNKIITVLDIDMTDKSEEEIVAFIRTLVKYDISINDDIRLCNRLKEEYDKYVLELSEIGQQIRNEEEFLSEQQLKHYPLEVIEKVNEFNEKLKDYTVQNTYRMVFLIVMEEAFGKNKASNLKGLHRYDLYAQLRFAMKYFKQNNGTNKFICVDEGQDLAHNEYKLINEINQKDVIFNIYGDVNQLLKQGRGIEDWQDVIHYFSANKYLLNENYRNTNQITKFCNDSFHMNTLQTGVDGAKVKEIRRIELEDALSKLQITTERIAVLIPRVVSSKKRYVSDEILPEGVRALIKFDKIDKGLISIMYVDEVKGIEFDKVFVVPHRMTKNEKYIAYTRALSELIIVVDEIVDEKHSELEQD